MAKFSFDEFKNEIVDKIREFLPETFKDAEVSLQIVTKNNDLQLTGLTIRSVGTNISPTIYLDTFYEDYKNGKSLQEIMKKIAEVRVFHDVNDDFDTTQITDYRRCKDRIIPRLVNAERNSEHLASRPHIYMEDLAVEYAIFLGSDEGGLMTVPITDALINSWNISLDELHSMAISNIPTVIPSTIRTMCEVIREMLSDDIDDELFDGAVAADNLMFILSNKHKMYGASAILDKAILKEMEDKVGRKFYILPSSIHEQIIVPYSTDNASYLANMVREVNATQVGPEDFLSDHVYLYDDGEITIAD